MRAAEFGVLIADDEPAARRGVRQLLSAFPAFNVIGECRNGAEVLETLDALEAPSTTDARMPHVLFLDIQMPGLGGFDVIRRRTPERMPAVVFLTAFDQFAIQAFDVQAVDYLLKPVSETRFAATMRRLQRQLAMPGAAAVSATVVVPTPRGTAVVPVSEIDWIESADNYARIWASGRSYLLRESMQSLERRIGASGFARAHRRAIVQLSRIRALEQTRDGELRAVLASGAKVPVSRRRRAAFARRLRGIHASEIHSNGCRD